MAFYFDNAATTVMAPRVKEAYNKESELFFANPSSSHREGQKAKEELERIRTNIASIMNVKSSSIIFTSGATEAISLFFESLSWLDPGTIIISKIEHEAVSSWIPWLKRIGWSVITLRAKNGLVSPEELLSSLTPDTKAVCIMRVNNVTGAIESIDEYASIIRDFEKSHSKKILFFSDSVQALSKIDYSLDTVDAASFSAHKINGPRGIGILYSKNPDIIHPLAPAGGQEHHHRGGTENLPAIRAMEEALIISMENKDEKRNRIKEINITLRNELNNMGLKLLSPIVSSPYILSFVSPIPSEVFSRILMDKGYLVSAGSACSNNAKGKAEGILEAMGIKHSDSTRAIRISLSNETTKEETLGLIEAIREGINGK